MSMELLKSMAGIDLQHVPYRGTAAAMTDVISGQIKAMFANALTARPQIDAGTVRARLVVSESLPLWLLDEPFSALDASAIALVEVPINAHVARGGSVVFTSHQEPKTGTAQVIDLGAAAT